MCVCMYVYTCMHAYIHAYICMYMLYDTILMDIYSHICIHMHTNVHTRFLNHPHMGKRVKTQFSSSLKTQRVHTIINFFQFVVAPLSGF